MSTTRSEGGKLLGLRRNSQEEHADEGCLFLAQRIPEPGMDFVGRSQELPIVKEEGLQESPSLMEEVLVGHLR